jgi:hypothetical protein
MNPMLQKKKKEYHIRDKFTSFFCLDAVIVDDNKNKITYISLIRSRSHSPDVITISFYIFYTHMHFFLI